MIVDRRRLFLKATAAIMSVSDLSWSLASAIPVVKSVQEAAPRKWDPMVEAILDRGRTGDGRVTFDRDGIEDAIDRRAKATEHRITRIRWFETPADAYTHLAQLGLDTLLQADTTRFWKFDDRATRKQTFEFAESAYDAQSEAEKVFRVDEREADVSAPKHNARDQALARNISAQDVFYARAVSSQIGWLETVMPRAAAHSIFQLEMLLRMGHSEAAPEVKNLMTLFEVYEQGLLATWETSAEMICVPIIRRLVTATRTLDTGRSC